MAVYVDDMQVDAEVPNGDHVVRGRWSHLMADSEAELRDFARKLGLRESWIQHPGEAGVHFDVTQSKRQQAINLGAREITWREAGQRYAERVRQGQDDPQAVEQVLVPAVAQRSPGGRARHSWAEGMHESQKACRHCGMGAEQRWNPATGRPVVIYSQGDRRLVAERVPPCGSQLPGSGLSEEEARHLAGAADRKAGEAFRAVDFDRAFRLLTDARVLDPAGFQTWNWHERQLREKVSAAREQASKAAERVPPDAEVIAQETREWAEWNRLVGVRTPAEREGAAS